MKRIIFVVAHLAQPRCIRRIKALHNAGFQIKVYGYDTGLYSENINDYGVIPVKVISSTKGYGRIRRTIQSIKDLKQICKNEDSNDIIYVFGFPLGFAIRFFTKKINYIYEEADMMPSNTNKVQQFFLKLIDKLVISKSLITVFTSEGFSKFIYGEKIPENVIVVPNKLNNFIIDYPRPKIFNLDEKHLSFGFVGAIRFPNTIVRFAQVVGENFPQHKFHFYGDGSARKNVEKLVEMYSNIKYHGPFKSPQDLSDIYSNIDINIVCYDTEVTGMRINEPNKLYETIYFGKPIVVSKNTFLATKVNKLKIGFSINATNNQDIKGFIDKLSKETCIEYGQNALNIPSEELIDDPQVIISRIGNVL